MRKRKIIHPKYYAIDAYMILAKKSYHECADHLGISERTYKEKITGYSDFSAEQGRKLALFLNCSQSEIFLI